MAELLLSQLGTTVMHALPIEEYSLQKRCLHKTSSTGQSSCPSSVFHTRVVEILSESFCSSTYVNPSHIIMTNMPMLQCRTTSLKHGNNHSHWIAQALFHQDAEWSYYCKRHFLSIAGPPPGTLSLFPHYPKPIRMIIYTSELGGEV